MEDKSREAAEKYNMEIKTLNFEDTMDFCSRFIVLTKFGYVTVGDPIKMLVRLGRFDIQGLEHVEAMSISWKDMLGSSLSIHRPPRQFWGRKVKL